MRGERCRFAGFLLPHGVMNPALHCRKAGAFPGRRLRCLARGMVLIGLPFSFDGDDADALAESFFHDGPNSGVLEEIVKITGIEELKVEPLLQPIRLRGVLEFIKARMEKKSAGCRAPGGGGVGNYSAVRLAAGR
jgi:hypothetical protein